MKHEHITLDCCDSIEVHQELLNIVNEKLPPEEVLYDLAELFKVFGDSTGSGYYLFSLKQRYAYAIWQRH